MKCVTILTITIFLIFGKHGMPTSQKMLATSTADAAQHKQGKIMDIAKKNELCSY